MLVLALITNSKETHAMKTKQLKREEAILRNSKHRARYEAECRIINPNATDPEVKAFADHKQGIPKTRWEVEQIAIRLGLFTPTV